MVFLWIVLFSKKDCLSCAVKSWIDFATSSPSTGLNIGFRKLFVTTSFLSSAVTRGFNYSCFCLSNCAFIWFFIPFMKLLTAGSPPSLPLFHSFYFSLKILRASSASAFRVASSFSTLSVLGFAPKGSLFLSIGWVQMTLFGLLVHNTHRSVYGRTSSFNFLTLSTDFYLASFAISDGL